MKPYPEYKPTGLAWLPEVPSGWDVKRGKQVFRVINERSNGGKEKLLSVSENYGVIERSKADVTMFMAESYDGYKLCWPDDLVINSLWAWSYGMGFSHDHGIVSTAYGVYRLVDKNRFLPAYYNYFVRGTDFHWEMRVRSKGLWKSRYQLSDDAFLSAPFLVPPPAEQARIVAYLDAETAKIDRLIKLKEREIELLNEKKQATISQVVTRGLDPNAELVDSGVDWIGQVPKGWKVCRFKYLVDICSNLVDPNQHLTMQQIAPECIEKNSGRLVEERKVCEAGVISWNHLFKKGQLIYSKIRPLLNKIVIAPYDGLCSADMYPLETTLNPKWLLVQMLSPFFLSQVKECCDRVKMPKINQEDLSKLFLLSPPEDDQRAIVAYLDTETAKIDAAVKAIEKSIALLKERRVRLVSDAVTGRIDLREGAA